MIRAFSMRTLEEMLSKNFWKSLKMHPAFWFSLPAISACSDLRSAARRQLLPLEAESVLRVCSDSHSVTSLSIRHCILYSIGVLQIVLVSPDGLPSKGFKFRRC